jgi:hypothetical protein
MAPTAALLQENFKTARFDCRQPGNVFVNRLSELNHLPSSHVKRPPHARNTGEGGASVPSQIYCGKISERAKRARTTLSPHKLVHATDPRKHDPEHPARQQKWASGGVLELLVDFFGVSFLEVFSSPNVHYFDPRDAQRAEALRKIAEAQDELRRLA